MATARLNAAGIERPERDARRLVAFAAGTAPDRLTLHLRDDFTAAAALERALSARLARQPVAQITGERLFWGRSFRVTPEVLDPRPETEELIAAALEEPFARLLDLGTGTGCIALTLLAERPSATGLATDLSQAALAVAQENARRFGVSVEFVLSDWFSGVTGRFDLIVSNPPYIAAAEMAGLAPRRATGSHIWRSPTGATVLAPIAPLRRRRARIWPPAGGFSSRSARGRGRRLWRSFMRRALKTSASVPIWMDVTG